MNEILIHLGSSGWLATYVGPHAKEIGKLFGTCTIPTPFSANVGLNNVCREVAKLNPGVMVGHWRAR
jgi:hypothetical protein